MGKIKSNNKNTIDKTLTPVEKLAATSNDPLDKMLLMH